MNRAWQTAEIEIIPTDSGLHNVTPSLSDIGRVNSRAVPYGIVLSTYKYVNVSLTETRQIEQVSPILQSINNEAYFERDGCLHDSCGIIAT